MYYFAYGSNLHPLRLTERVPSAKAVGVSQLGGYFFTLNHPSHDGSGKCNICPTTGSKAHVVGVIYQIENSTDKRILDEIEGEQFGWHAIDIKVLIDNAHIHAFTYIAPISVPNRSALPYHWYRDIVLLGALFHGLPEPFIEQISTADSQPDLNRPRNEANQHLVTRLRATI